MIQMSLKQTRCRAAIQFCQLRFQYLTRIYHKNNDIKATILAIHYQSTELNKEMYVARSIVYVADITILIYF